MAQTDRLTGLVGNAAFKVPCMAATTAPITLAGEQTIDGLACTTGMRVLVKDQVDLTDNGIYVVDTGAWALAQDADGVYDWVEGSLITVLNGTQFKYYELITANPIAPGTSGMVFASSLVNAAALIGFLQAGTGAVERDSQAKMRDVVSAFDFMTAAQVASVQARDETQNVTASLAIAVAAAILSKKALFLPAGLYSAVLSVRGNNVAIYGEGSAVVEIKHPNVAVSNVLELGDTASGNSATAYSGIVVSGVTLNGNRSVVGAPANDLVGHGLPLTKISKFHISDVRAINCYNAGVGIFIDSNYGYADVAVENCGNATAGQTTAGFDINSSKYGQFTVVSKDCYAGGRILDNCYGNHLRIAVQNATKDGFNYNNQSVNSSYANTIDLQVYTCGQHGLNIGENCSNSNIRATIYNATAKGCVIGDATAHPSSNNTIDLVTYNSGAAGLLINSDGNDNMIRHQSNLDGRTGAVGASFAVDVSGQRNKLMIDLIDSATWQVRGIAMRAAALDNEILSYTYTNTLDPINDGAANTRTKFNHGQGRGVDIASAGTITVPPTGNVFHITGATGINTMNGFGQKDQAITLIFDSTPTVTKGSNLKLGAGGNLVATAGSTLSGIWDGTNFYETGRSVT